MMNITSDMKLADVLFHNYTLLPVISRFNIKLGFGDKTVSEVCVDSDVNIDFFLEITNSYVDEDYIPQKELNSFPVSLIVNYLKKTHQYYLDEKIPEIERYIHLVIEAEKSVNDKFKLVESFFTEYKQELTNHINREETSVHPYVLEIESAFLKNEISSILFSKIRKYSINDYASEHDNVEEKLFDLKNIIIKYLPPCNSSAICNTILIELFRLEKDLNAHANLEDKVLIPKVALMEEKLLSLFKA
jgi:regulator of cell morphogenesis and NO signaling